MSEEDSASKRENDNTKLALKTQTGLVKMNEDPEEGAIQVQEYKERNNFAPHISDEFVNEGGELSSRPKVEFPDLRPVLSVSDVAVAEGYSKDQVVKFMQRFVEDMKPKGDPYAKRSKADYSPPPLDIGGNDGYHIWWEIFKYGRQTVSRICKKLGAYDPLYTQGVLTVLINAGYVFLYQDGTIDVIPDKVRDKILHPPEKQWVIDQRIQFFRALPSLRSMEPVILEKDKYKEHKMPEKMRVVDVVEEKDYIESAKLKRNKVIIRKESLDKEESVEAAGIDPDDEYNYV